jgi:diphthamide biosynthesis protein 4
MPMPDHYEVLGLQARRYATDLSPQEVKQAYKRALLQHHPDKGSTLKSDHIHRDGDSIVTVDDVTNAYKVLSDSGLRLQYDKDILQEQSKREDFAGGRVHRTGLETVDLDALEFDAQSDIWSRSCRCGDVRGYIVTEPELEKNADAGELTVGCRGCSLWLRVLFSVEE